ncbi:MAG TPA: glycerol-3-phosphate 1-O-acyltransferase PlsY [Fimbriimonas sp.]
MNGTLLFLLVAAYFVGAIPFGVMIARAHGVDILKLGSGNPGATNVKRVIGSKAGYTVLALDVLKGVLPAVLARSMIQDRVGVLDPQAVWLLIGFAAVLGHCLSPFLGFRGGKGIATSLGAGIAAAPFSAVPAFLVFLAVFGATHYVSLASMLAIASAMLWIVVIPGQSWQLLPAFAVLTAFAVYRHRANIRRLLDGTEAKSYFGENASTTESDTDFGENASTTESDTEGDR